MVDTVCIGIQLDAAPHKPDAPVYPRSVGSSWTFLPGWRGGALYESIGGANVLRLDGSFSKGRLSVDLLL